MQAGPEQPEEAAKSLSPGVRVSLEVPEAGTCVARISKREGPVLWLDLLDEVGEGELPPGSTVELFLPRTSGIYHWLCVLSASPVDQKAQVELLSPAMFVQRRLGHRTGVELEALVRRLHSGRRGQAHQMTVADLSRGGMKLNGQFQASTGDTLEVTVRMSPFLRVVDRVVMAYQSGPGQWAAHVSFLDGQREAFEAVDTYIASRARGISPKKAARR
jgi:hypothetical protein